MLFLAVQINKHVHYYLYMYVKNCHKNAYDESE